MRTNKAAYDGPDVATRTGPFVKYIGRGGTYVIAKKGGQNSGKHSQAVRDNRKLFADVTALMHLADGETYQWCRDQAKGTLYLPRDILAKLLYGTLFRYETVDGKYKIGARMVGADIQKMLDGISQNVGAILVRTKDGWAAVEPGTGNQVLAIDPISMLPFWRNETASAPQAQACLDQVSAAEGAVLYRSADVWKAIEPGNSGQYLRINPTTGEPAWDFVVLNTQEISDSLDGFSSSPGSFLVRTNKMWTTLPVGQKGQYLIVDKVSGFPTWETVETENIQANLVLNTISTDIGAIITRGKDDWEAIEPGADGNVLTSRGPGQTPMWRAGSGGGQAAIIEHITEQVDNPEIHADYELWSRLLPAGTLKAQGSIIRLHAVVWRQRVSAPYGIQVLFDNMRVAGCVLNDGVNDDIIDTVVEFQAFENKMVIMGKTNAWGGINNALVDWGEYFEKEIDYSQEHTISLKVRMPNMSGLNAGAISLKSVLLEFLA